MYKRLISPKVYSKETDLTYKTPKRRIKNLGTGVSVGAKPITPILPEGFFLLLENGDFILTEDNNKIIL